MILFASNWTAIRLIFFFGGIASVARHWECSRSLNAATTAIYRASGCIGRSSFSVSPGRSWNTSLLRRSPPSVFCSLSKTEKKSPPLNAASDFSSYNFITTGEGLPRESGFKLGCAFIEILTITGFGVLAHPLNKRRVIAEI